MRITGNKDWYDTLGNGNSLPSRVVGEAGVRNPALLNRPVLASHRDPQPGSLQQGVGFARSRVQPPASGMPQGLAGRGFESLNGSLAAQRAQHESSFAPRTAGNGFQPNQPYGQPYSEGTSASVHALAAMLGNSNMSPADVSQLASIAGNTHAGNLNQLISQLQMATQLAQSQGEPQEPLVETTHRVVIPAAHLKEGSHAIARANQAAQQGPKTGATVADGGKIALQQGRALSATAPEPQSALDVVAEAAVEAAEANNEEPSELLM